ncbi:hypothetical protein [uncultured Nostoc sp.]
MRVGLVRRVEQKDNAINVARMGQYPEVVQQLHSPAIDQELLTYILVEWH